MNTNPFKIQITNPCANDWNEMNPSAAGRFCDACSKSVIDFSEKSDAEIKAYLLQHRNEKICGRFQKQQVDRIRIEIDPNLLYTGIPFWQKFLVIVLVAFGQDFLGVDFCLSQTVQDSTTVQTEQIDSAVVEVMQSDSTTDTTQQSGAITPFIWETKPWEFENRLTGPASMFEVQPEIWTTVTMISGDISIVDAPPAEAEISLIDSLRDTNTVTGFIPVSGFPNDAPKAPKPKNTPDRQPQFMIAEEKKRSRRKKRKPHQAG